jgi:hypothetical protein
LIRKHVIIDTLKKASKVVLVFLLLLLFGYVLNQFEDLSNKINTAQTLIITFVFLGLILIIVKLSFLNSDRKQALRRSNREVFRLKQRQQGFLGIIGDIIYPNVYDESELKRIGLTIPLQGVFIDHVIEDSPSENGILIEGETVLRIENIQITSSDALRKLIYSMRPFQEVEVTVLRNYDEVADIEQLSITIITIRLDERSKYVNCFDYYDRQRNEYVVEESTDEANFI